MSCGSILLNEVIAPGTNDRIKELQAAALKQQGVTEKPFSFYDNETESLIFVKDGLDPEKGILKNVWITQYFNDKEAFFFYSKRSAC